MFYYASLAALLDTRKLREFLTLHGTDAERAGIAALRDELLERE